MLPNPHKRKIILAVLVAASAVMGLIFRSSSPGAVELEISGGEKVIFDSDVSGCDGHHLPDAPARAFRDDRGRMVLFAPNFRNRAFVGYGFDSLKPDCDSRFMAAGKAEPGLLDDRTWIHAIYTDDGKTVYALGSASFMPYRHDMPCKDRTKRTDCWINGLVTLKSTDGGKKFSYLGTPPRHAPFPPPEPYRDDRKRAPSYVTVTNLINWQGDLYAIVWRREEEWQNSRNCLVRAPAGDPGHWQVWDGVDFVDAAELTDTGWKTYPTECGRVGPKGITSIRGFVRHEGTNSFIAIYQHRQRNKDGTDRHGFFYSTSEDMKHWSEPKFLLAEDLMPDAGPGDPFAAYATMIDDDSADRLFGTVDDRASLVFVRLIPKRHKGGWRVARQLVRFPVTIKE